MITFINKELFKLETNEVSGDRGTFYKTSVLAAPKVKTGKDNTLGHRMITKIVSPVADYSELNVSVNVTEGHNGFENLSIRASEHNKYDADLIMIAIPFNGIAQPIPESKEYRIHKGIVLNSDKRNITLGDGEDQRTYKKVLYLIVEPNTALFDETHKYHTKEIVLPFTYYNLESRGGDDNNVETEKTTVVIAFKEDCINYNMTSEIVEPIDPESFKGEKLFVTAQHKKKNNSGKNNDSKEKQNRNKKFNNNKGKR